MAAVYREDIQILDMPYIYLDESGDLGFDFSKKRTSRFFVITFLCCENKRQIEKVVATTYSELEKRHKTKSGVLHCHFEKTITRTRLLNRLAKTNCKIMTLYLDKTQVHRDFQAEKNRLYGWMTSILLNRIVHDGTLGAESDKIVFIASRRETSKFLNKNFKRDLKKNTGRKELFEMSVEIKTTFEEKGLQAIDFVSWTIFHRLETGDERHYGIIKSLIVDESALFLKNKTPYAISEQPFR